MCKRSNKCNNTFDSALLSTVLLVRLAPFLYKPEKSHHYAYSQPLISQIFFVPKYHQLDITPLVSHQNHLHLHKVDMLASGPTPTCAIMAETDENGSLDWKILSATTTPRKFAASSGHRFSPLTIPQEGLLKSQSTYGCSYPMHQVE